MALTKKEIARRKVLGAQRAEVAYIIAHEMKKRGWNRSDIARHIGISLAVVSATINGKRHSPRVLDAIINLGVSPDLLYDPRQKTRQAMPAAKQRV